MFASWNDFTTWERESKDTIDVKKIYIDAAKDFMAGVLLSQIIYWYLPNKEGKSKLRVKKGGHFWIAKKRSEWYEEIRFTEANYKTAVKKLEKEGLVVKERFKFEDAPTTHIRLNVVQFLKKLNELLAVKKEELDDEVKDFNDYINQQIKGELPSSLDSVESTESIRSNQPNGNGRINRMETVESTECITENTTEITSEITNKEEDDDRDATASDLPPLPSSIDTLLKTFQKEWFGQDCRELLAKYENHDLFDMDMFSKKLEATLDQCVNQNHLRSYLEVSIDEALKQKAKREMRKEVKKQQGQELTIYQEQIEQIVKYMNKKKPTQGKFDPNRPQTQKLISNLLEENFTVDDFFTVIDNKAEDHWFSIKKNYFRPRTLFKNAEKFEEYLNEERETKYERYKSSLPANFDWLEEAKRGNEGEQRPTRLF